MQSRDKKANGLNDAVILLAMMALTHIANVEGKPQTTSIIIFICKQFLNLSFY